MSKIIALCPIHRNTDLVIEQIINYDKYSQNNFSHILHPSIEGRPNLNLHYIEKALNKGSILITNNSWRTSWVSAMSAFLNCSRLIEQFSNSHSYVYIHTDGDLLIRSGVDSWICDHKIGFNLNGFLAENCGWIHAKNALLDSQLIELKNYLGLNESDIVIGRQEGSFFTIDLWKNIIFIISKFFTEEYFQKVKNYWPLEEVLIPTLAKYFLGHIPSSKNLIKTKEFVHLGGRDNDLNMVNINDINALRSNPSELSFGMKWFSQDLKDPARLYLK